MLRPLTLIVGASGKGKSTAIRNLNPKTTFIFNIENKALPFPNANLYSEENKNMITPKKAIFMAEQLKKVVEQSHIETIVIDSFTSWMEALEEECLDRFGESGDGRFKAWGLFGKEIRKLFLILKSSEKYVFVTGIHEILLSEDGEKIKRLKTLGKRWEGMVEKEATTVLWSVTGPKENADPDSKMPNIDYYFETQTDGATSAKSPMGVFDSFRIPNDMQFVLDAYKKFYKDEKKDKPLPSDVN